MDNSAKPVILVVEDDPDLNKILALQLSSEGFSTVVADNGVEAFRVIQETQPDCIILDLMMPVMDGFSFLKRIRSLNHTADVPVIILSASEDHRHKLKSRQFLADLFMNKPYDLQELTEEVRKLVQARETHAQ
jgi:DNA-binding response OmpR family regulator